MLGSLKTIEARSKILRSNKLSTLEITWSNLRLRTTSVQKIFFWSVTGWRKRKISFKIGGGGSQNRF